MDGTISERADGVVQTAQGSATSDGTAITLNLGFDPLEMVLVNSTDAIVWHKIAGMAAANSLKTAGVATTPASSQVTVDTGSAILFNGDGTVTISATAAGSAKALAWVARR